MTTAQTLMDSTEAELRQQIAAEIEAAAKAYGSSTGQYVFAIAARVARGTSDVHSQRRKLNEWCRLGRAGCCCGNRLTCDCECHPWSSVGAIDG